MSIRVHQWLTALALAAVTLAVYWPTGHHSFTGFDDPNYLTENRHVQAGLTRSGLAWAFLNLHGENTYWHPITWVSHMLDCQFFGLNAGPHHLVNVVFHAANSLLLLVVLNRMTGAFWRSSAVAALFALHPLQVETVAWAAERKSVLSTLFWLLTIWAYGRYAEDVKTKAESRKQKAENPDSAGHASRLTFHVSSFYLLSLAYFALGLMCKPALVTLPFVLLLLDYWPLRRLRFPSFNIRGSTFEVQGSGLSIGGSVASPSQSLPRSPATTGVALRRLVLEKLPFLALAAAASATTLAAHHELGADWSSHLPWEWRVNNALVSYIRYLGKALWPTHLAVYYPHPGAWPLWTVIGSALVLASVSGWVFWRARRAPYLVTGWLWFLGVLVPMIGIIQAGGQAMADRFAYMPLIGLFIVAVWAAADLLARLGGGAGGPEPKAPGPNPRAQCPGNGSMIVHGSTEEGECITNHGSRVTNHASSYCCAVLAALALGGCLWLTSRQVSYWQNTTTLFEHALRVTRNNACAHYMLGSALLEQGRVEEAMQKWETALQIEPWWANTHGRIALILSGRGDFPGAIARYRQALEIDPNQHEVLNNLAWLLATCPDASLRDGPEAVLLAERACAVTRFRKAILIGTLGAAYAEAGRFPEAVATAQKACDLAEIFKEEALLAKNRELLALYRAGKPYHEPGKGEK